MKKYFSLIVKDLTLMKSTALFNAAIVVGVPFVAFAGVGSGLALFTFTFVLVLCRVTQSLAYYDGKAEAFLCALPYSRRSIVLARYALMLALYAVSLAVYSILALAVPRIPTLSAADAACALLSSCIVAGFTQPLYYRFGCEKTRYIFMFVFVGAAVGLPYAIPHVPFLTGGTAGASSLAVATIAFVLSAAVLTVSALVSVAIYKKKEF